MSEVTDIPAAEDQDFLNSGLQRFHEDSRPNRYVRLELGDSSSESILFDFDGTNLEDFESRCNNLRNSVNKARITAAGRSGMEFEMNSGTFLTRNNDIVFTVVLTRRA